jgi:hypothetical protein
VRDDSVGGPQPSARFEIAAGGSRNHRGPADTVVHVEQDDIGRAQSGSRCISAHESDRPGVGKLPSDTTASQRCRATACSTSEGIDVDHTTNACVRAVGAVLVLALACANEPAQDDDAADTSTSGAPPDTTGGDDAPADESSGAGETTAGYGPDDGDITFYRDVLPIFGARCLACHTTENIAPMSLLEYETAWTWRESVAVAVESRTMPPWLPGQGCNDYANDRSATDEEIATILAWVDENGPRGDPADAPEDLVPEPAVLPRVDVEMIAPEPYTPASPDDYRCFLLDWPLEEPAYVTGFRAVPENIAVVHHIIAYRIAPANVATYEALDADDPEPGYTCFGGPGGSVADPAAGAWLGAWAPGGGAAPYPEGTGLRMEPGSKVVLQIHYNTASGDTDPDRSGIEIMIEPSVEREAFMMLWADPDWLFGEMPIPAGSPDTVHQWELDPTSVLDFLTDVVPPNSPLLIHSTSHHMHLLGQRADHTILRADGSETCLLDIPRWDFGWQTAYRFAEPVVFEPGDRLRLACQWDNSAGDADVNWGEGTGDEMCLGIYYVTGM